MQVGVVLPPGDRTAAGGDDQAGHLAQLGQDLTLLGPEGCLTGGEDKVGAGHAQGLFDLHIAVHEGAVQQVGQLLAHSGFTRAGHTDEDTVLFPAAQGAVGLLGADGGNGPAGEELAGAAGLLHQHVEAAQTGDV